MIPIIRYSKGEVLHIPSTYIKKEKIEAIAKCICLTESGYTLQGLTR